MSDPFIALFAIYAIIIAAAAFFVRCAPNGFEDSQGWHPGTPNTSTQPHHHSSDMLGEQGRGVDTVQHSQGASR